MKRENATSNVWDGVLILAAAAAAVILAYLTCMDSYWVWDWNLEGLTYALVGLCCLRRFHRLADRMSGKGGRIAAAVVISLLYTVLVCLYNNALHFLAYNFADPGWALHLGGDVIPYGYFLWKDLVYSIGWGELRYPAVFLVMLLGCLADRVVFGKRVQNMLQALRRRMDGPDGEDEAEEGEAHYVLPLAYIIIEQYHESLRPGVEQLLRRFGQGLRLHEIELAVQETSGVLFAALSDETVIGFIAARRSPDSPDHKVGEILALVTIDEDMGGAAARELVSRAEKWLLEQGLVDVDVDYTSMPAAGIEALHQQGYTLRVAILTKAIAAANNSVDVPLGADLK